MKEKNYNNSSLQRALGYKSPSSVQRWVAGSGMPELSAIKEIAKALGVSPSYLLEGVEDKKSYEIKSNSDAQLVQEPVSTYGISKEDLIEFYKWKAAKSKEEAEKATKQVERLKSTEVDAN